MAQRLFPSINGAVSAKNIQRLDRNPQGPAVGNRTDSASACQHRHRAIDRRIHVRASNDLVTDQAAFGTVALQAPFGLDQLPRETVAGEPGQPAGSPRQG